MRRASFLVVVAFMLLTAGASPVRAETSGRQIFRRPTIPWVVFSAAWVGGSIWAQPRHDFVHSTFSYVPAVYTGLYVGAATGGLLGESLASPSREGPNWGPPFVGMVVGGLIGAGGGVALGYAASRNRVVYYGTQGAYVSVLMFTTPLVSF